MKAVILAGGEGTRLRPLTSNTPKPMLPMANRPMLEHIVRLLASHGFDEIIVTKYLAGTDQTIPIWIYKNLQRPTNRPIVNVVALVVGLLAIVPVYLAQRLAAGFFVAPNTVLNVCEPEPNSGVLDLPKVIAPAACQR